MSNVLPFAPRPKPEPYDPHGSGGARCLACGHEWVQVAPVGDFCFDCPKCKATCGVWAAPFAFPNGYAVFTCLCGCGHFALALNLEGGWALMCRKCAAYHNPGNILGSL